MHASRDSHYLKIYNKEKTAPTLTLGLPESGRAIKLGLFFRTLGLAATVVFALAVHAVFFLISFSGPQVH